MNINILRNIIIFLLIFFGGVFVAIGFSLLACVFFSVALGILFSIIIDFYIEEGK